MIQTNEGITRGRTTLEKRKEKTDMFQMLVKQFPKYIK